MAQTLTESTLRQIIREEIKTHLQEARNLQGGAFPEEEAFRFKPASVVRGGWAMTIELDGPAAMGASPAAIDAAFQAAAMDPYTKQQVPGVYKDIKRGAMSLQANPDGTARIVAGNATMTGALMKVLGRAGLIADDGDPFYSARTSAAWDSGRPAGRPSLRGMRGA